MDAALSFYPEAVFATHNGEIASTNDLSHFEGFLTHAERALGSLTWLPTAETSGSGNRSLALGNALPLDAGSAYESGNYSYKQGNALFLVINTYLTDTAHINAAKAWITSEVNALGSAKASTWVIASIPTQFYGSSSVSSTIKTQLQAAFRDAGVALVLQGGAKAYTRSWPIKRDTALTVYRNYPTKNQVATEDGVVYLAPGASGVEQSSVSSSAKSTSSGWLAVYQEDLSSADQKAANKKTYSSITVREDALFITARTATGELMDHFSIYRQATGPIAPPELPKTVLRLDTVGLNNGFGADAKTTRVFTWLYDKGTTFTSPYVKVVPAGQSLASAPETACTSALMVASLDDFRGYTCSVTGLTAGTSYQYVVGGYIGFNVYESPTYTFKTDDGVSAFTFLDFADSQSGSSNYNAYWGNTLRTAVAAHPEAVIATHTGDIVDSTSSSHLEAWVGAVGTTLSSVAFNPVLGNHDDSTSHAPMWAALFPRTSSTPVPTYSEPNTLQYSYVYGNALMLHVNTNLDTAAQLKITSQWIHDAIAKDGTAPNGKPRFVIVFEHKSPFGGTHSGSGAYPTGDYGNPAIVAELPRTYDDEGVDLVLAGHDHNLIRSYPIRWNYATNKATWNTAASGTTIDSNADGLIYYIPRESGDKTYSLISTPTATSRPWINWNWRLTTNYSAAENTVFSAVTVDDSKIVVKTYRTGDTVNPIDQFTITQSGEKPPAPPVFAKFSQNTWELTSAAATLSVGVSTSCSSWTITDDAAWLTQTPITGTVDRNITVTAAVNTTTSARTGTVTISGCGKTDTLKVTQAKNITLTVAPATWAIAWTGGSTSAVVTTSQEPWSIDWDTVPDWLVFSFGAGVSGDRFVVYAEKNLGAQRTATISVVVDGLTKTFTVTQYAAAAATLTVAPMTWAAPFENAAQVLTVTSNRDYSWTSDATWLTATGGDEIGSLMVAQADPNPGSTTRVGHLTITNGTLSRVVTVTQAAGPTRSWPIGTTFQEYDSDAGTWYFDTGLDAYGTVTVTDDVAWLTATHSEAGLLKLVFTKNTSALRYGTITVRSGTKILSTFVVAQDGVPTLTYGAATYAVAAAGGYQSRVITTNRWNITGPSQWVAAAWEDWLHVPNTAGDSGTNLTIIVDKNTTGVARTGEVVIVTPGGYYSITVTQAR